MKRSSKFLISSLAFALVVGLVGYFALGVFGRGSLPSDASLIADFNKNQTSLEELRKVFDGKNRLSQLTPFSATPLYEFGADKGSPLPEEQIRNYRPLFEAVGVRYARRQTDDGKESIRLGVKAIDIDSRNLTEDLYEEKGFAYCEVALSPLRDSLDNESANGGLAYRKIADHWYLFYAVKVNKPE